VEETLRILVCLGFALLLIMLRLDAARCGVAEYLDEAVGSALAVLRRRLSWYGLGLAFCAVILIVHPDPEGQLGLRIGDDGAMLLAGLGLAAIGAAQAAGVALVRSGRLRLPSPSAYPWGIANALTTALVDEVAFRGVILGLLLATGLDAVVAVVVQALVYALATRTGAPGSDPYLLALSLAIGLVGGWLTVATGGIGAAFVAHGVTRFAAFAFLGAAGSSRDASDGPDGRADRGRRGEPDGWQAVGPQGSGVRSG